MRIKLLLASAVFAVGIGSLSCEQQKQTQEPQPAQEQKAQEVKPQEAQPPAQPQVKEEVKEVKEAVQQEVQQAQEQVKEAVKEQVQQAQEKVEEVKEQVQDKVQEIKDKIQGTEQAQAQQEAAPAVDAKALAEKKGCFSCHGIDKKKVGPAYTEVAKRYAGKEGAVDELVKSIVKGSMGKWGSIPMAPQPVSEQEAKVLAEWILNIK